jgi:ubiquinone/menaquinone biosynthesis C-methylase UbiE
MSQSKYKAMVSFYDLLLEPILHKMRRTVVQTCNVKSGDKILEVACGTGAQASRFRSSGARYIGIDISQAMLNIASRRGLNCIQADGCSLPFENNDFDVATISLALHQVDPDIRSSMFREIIRVTKPDGRIIVADYTISASDRIFPRIQQWIIRRIEQGVGGDHYRNFKIFMESGGLHGFLEKSPSAWKRITPCTVVISGFSSFEKPSRSPYQSPIPPDSATAAAASAYSAASA